MVTAQKRRYGEYVLEDSQSRARAIVCPERGGAVVSFSVGGREVLWLDREVYEDPTQNVQGGIPILFPICSILPDDAYQVNGQVYRLPLHGFTRSVAWKEAFAPAADASEVTLVLRSSGLSKAMYPYDFEYQITYALKGTSLTTRVSIKNLSDADMPIQYGFHPFLNLSVKDETVLLETDGTQYFDLGDQAFHPFRPHMDLTDDRSGKLFFDTHTFSVTDPADGCKIIFTGSAEFSTYLLWSGDGKRYCVEPWTAGINAMNTGEKLIYVKPGETHESWYTIQVEAAAP